MSSSRRLAFVATLLGCVTCDAFSAGRLAPFTSLSMKQISTTRQRPQCPNPQPSKRSSSALYMAGFGGGRAKNPEETPPKLTSGEGLVRIALKDFNALKRDGGTVAQVHARLKGTETWLLVGSVCTLQGETAEGVQGQKRLILEHAVTMYSKLRAGTGQKVAPLEVGFSMEEGGEVTLCKAKYSGESVGVKLNPVPEGPFFKAVSKSGYAKDMSSAATLLEKKRYT